MEWYPLYCYYLLMSVTISFVFHGHQEPSFACQLKITGLHKVSHLINWTNPRLFFIGISSSLKSRPALPSLVFPLQTSNVFFHVFASFYSTSPSDNAFCYFFLLFSSWFLKSSFLCWSVFWLRNIIFETVILLRLEPFTTISPLSREYSCR